MVENVCEPLNLHYHFLSARMNSTDQETVFFYKKKSIKQIKWNKIKLKFIKEIWRKKSAFKQPTTTTNKQTKQHNSFQQWFLKDHVTLKTGVMAAENVASQCRNELHFKIY